MKKGFFVRPFPTVHVIPSQGYLIYHEKKKLKEEFQGAGREAIIAAKKSGIDVNTTWQVRPPDCSTLHLRRCNRAPAFRRSSSVQLWK